MLAAKTVERQASATGYSASPKSGRFWHTEPPERMKRITDFALACALIALVLPLAAIVALAIRLDSPGPVFSRHERLGRDGRCIVVLSFRTTVHNPQRTAPIQHQRRDITRIGGLLRYTRIDTLPQLVNVLRGEMSVIGTGRVQLDWPHWR